VKRVLGLIAVCVIFLTNCGSNSPSTPQVSVAISPSTQQSIDQGQTVNFTATVTNDSSNAGVTWSVSGTGCTGAACGALSNTTATAATYTAPASVSSNLTVSVTATSKTATSKTASSTVLVKAITVSLAPSAQSKIDQGQTVNFTATVANDPGSAGVTWSLSPPTGAGTLSGQTATTATYTAPASVSSNTTVSVTATSATNAGISTSSAVVVSSAPAITTTSLASGVVGTTYTQTLAATGGAGTLTWSITGALPAGLSLNTSTGVISGTPTAFGTFNFTVKVTDSAPTPMTASGPLSITINNPPLTITTTSLPNGQVGTAYSASLAAAGGASPYTWSVTVGSLPAGLNLNTSTGAITGNPTAAGTSNFTVKVTDSTTPTAQTQTKALSITIYAVLSISTTSLPNGAVGTLYSQNLVATGGATPYTWSHTGSLPAGLSLNTSTGVISGTPTATGTSGFTVTVTDSTTPTAQTKSQSLSITINGASGGTLTITTTSLPSGVVSTDYNGTVGVSGGAPPYTWGVTAGTLPAGLSLDTSTGLISGMPTATGTSNFTVTVTDSTTPTAQTKSQALSITISTVAACTSSGNESVLTGHYAFDLSGFNSTGFLAVVGAFTADGTGKITAGEADTNGTLGVHSASIDTTASSYSVGSDNRGCATIVTSFGTFNTRFALGSLSSGKATSGRMIEWEAPTSSAYIATGQLLQQTTPFTAPSGKYVFSDAGVDSNSTPGRFASAGVVTASGGNFSSGELDVNDAGTVTHATGMTGTYGSVDANGRFTGTTTIPSGPTSNDAFYMVSSSRFLFLGTDTPGTNALVVGEVRGQSGTFSNSSVSGNLVLYMEGLNGGGSGGRAQFGLVSANGSGSLTATIYEDDAGTWSAPNVATCTYSVAANGRMTLSGASCGNHPPVAYLSAANNGFMLDTDTGSGDGQVQAQTGSPFSVASVSGNLFQGTVEVANQAAETGVAAVTLNGSGGVSSTGDTTSTTYQQADQTSSGTITVGTDGTIISSDHPGIVTGIVVSSSQVVIIDNQGSTYPNISVVNK
jgi:Putative Ig domain